MVTTTDRNIGAILHMSQMSKYLFPFGGIIIPLIIWINKRQTSDFADQCGKSVLNFNLSMFLYYLVAITLFVIGVIYFAIDFEKINEIVHEATPVTLIAFIVIGVLFFIGLFLFEFIVSIIAALKASNGENYQYPFTINFLK
jgi:uncharacterized protein